MGKHRSFVELPQTKVLVHDMLDVIESAYAQYQDTQGAIPGPNEAEVYLVSAFVNTLIAVRERYPDHKLNADGVADLLRGMIAESNDWDEETVQ